MSGSLLVATLATLFSVAVVLGIVPFVFLVLAFPLSRLVPVTTNFSCMCVSLFFPLVALFGPFVSVFLFFLHLPPSTCPPPTESRLPPFGLRPS